MKVFTKENVENINNKFNFGKIISRSEKIYYQNIEGVRKSNIKYLYNEEELVEYSKCYNDIEYFYYKYFGTLFGYQFDIIKNFESGSDKLINLTSRQMGIDNLYSIIFLHQMLFKGKDIYIISHKKQSDFEFIEKVKNNYKKIPFFLKKGVDMWTKSSIKFENNSGIYIQSDDNIFDNDSILYFNDFAFINNVEIIFNNWTSKLNDKFNNHIIIHSITNGYNYFYKMVKNSELPSSHPDYNNYKTLRTYWYETHGRDEKWKAKEIKLLGSYERFSSQYNCEFINYKKEDI